MIRGWQTSTSLVLQSSDAVAHLIHALQGKELQIICFELLNPAFQRLGLSVQTHGLLENVWNINWPPLPWTKLSKEIFPVESVSHWAWAVATNTLHMQLKLQLETHETGQRHKSQDAKTSSSSCHEDCSVILAWSFLIFAIEVRKILRVYFKSDCGRIAIHLQLESIYPLQESTARSALQSQWP